MANHSAQKILLTGAAGFIGSNLSRRLTKQGHYIVGLDALTYAGHKENISDLRTNFKLIEGNIQDRNLVEKLFEDEKFTAVLNLAAESHVDRSITGSRVFLDTNIIGTHTLLESATNYWQKNPKFRFVQISTDEVFGSLGNTGHFNEQSPLDPRSPYSASKAAADHLVSAWHHTYGLPTIITRCTNNYGPYQFPEKLIPHMLMCALAEKPLPVYGNGENIRDWIHVEDHCLGIELALLKGDPGQSYCFGGHAEKRNIDLVNELCEILDNLKPRKKGSYRELISYVSDRPGHDYRYAIDDHFSQKNLGYMPKHNFQSGLRSTIQWYLENLSWCENVKGKK